MANPDEIKNALDRIEIGQQNVLGRLARVENRFDLLDDRARSAEKLIAVLQDRSDALHVKNDGALIASAISLLGMVAVGIVKAMDYLSGR
jgi:hypothetical protein